MRWFVEVSGSSGGSRAERYCLDAKAWQAALQETRKLRGDAAPLSRFSIELLDEGYRAIDPVDGLRYFVSQAPADAPLMTTPPNGISYPVPVSAAPVAVVEANSPVSLAPARKSVAPSAKAPRVVGASPGTVRQSTKPKTRLFRSREESPTPQAPITYREEAYLVASGLERDQVETILRERLSAVQAELRSSPPGQLVQLAVFDHEFNEKPRRPPLGTLAWKDWRGDPVFGFPAFGLATPPLNSRVPPPLDAPRTETELPSEKRNGAPSSNALSDRSSQAPSSPKKPTQASPEKPTQSSRPKLVVARRRVGEDLIAELFELMHDLHFARDIAIGSDFILNLLDEVIPSEISVVQVFDINTRNFVVVRARGPGAERALTYATPDTDPQISEIMRRERARVQRASGDSGFTDGRWSAFTRPILEVLSGPVRQDGRYLGLLELANPFGGTPFHRSEINAFDYVCAQFADFVASRPIVLEADVIIGR